MIDNERSSVLGGIVLVTGDGPEHHFVAHRIAETHDLRAILLCDPTPKRTWSKVLSNNPIQFVDKLAWKLLLALIWDGYARQNALKAVLGNAGTKFPADIPVERVGRPNSGRLTASLKDLSPAIIAVYGTGIIPSSALSQARLIALNLHTGVSPRYRGASCAFWPIYNGEPQWLGATVHECTSAVDGGRIFAIRHVTLQEDDNLHRIFARAVVVGVQAYVEVISQVIAGALDGTPQDLNQGREYSGRSRGFMSEIRARLRLKRLIQKCQKS